MWDREEDVEEEDYYIVNNTAFIICTLINFQNLLFFYKILSNNKK